MTEQPSLSIIVPVYNEKDLLQSAIDRINAFASQHFTHYEIIIIESGSTDGTARICDIIAGQKPYVRVVHEGGRNGFGSALKLGFKHAQNDWVWMITADVPFPLEAILAARPLFNQYDCILSYRSKDTRPFSRKIQSFFYNLLIKTALGLNVKHVNSAFKVYKRQVIQSVYLHANGWFIDSEILYRLKQQHVHWIEIPVELIDRTGGKSTVTVFSPLIILRELYNFLRYYR